MTRMDMVASDGSRIDPKNLCLPHLLGNHNECHQLAGYLRDASPDGHLYKLLGHAARGQIDLSKLVAWHDALEAEACRRGYEWDSPLGVTIDVPIGDGAITRSNTRPVDVRCETCAGRIGSSKRGEPRTVTP